MDHLAVSLLGGGTAVAAVAAGAIVAWLHVMPGDVDVVRHGVSAYGVGSRAAWYGAQVVITGAGALLLLAALVGGTTASPVGLAFLAAYAASRVAIARYPTDLEGQPLTRTGTIHALLAAVSFASLAAAAPLVALSLAPADVAGHDTIVRALSVGVAVSAVATFAAGSMPRLRAAFGLIERAFYATSLGWLTAVGLALALAHA